MDKVVDVEEIWGMTLVMMVVKMFIHLTVPL